MTSKQRSFTIYRIRDSIGGIPVTDFDDVISNLGDVNKYNLSPNYDFDASLYVAPSKEKMPPWVEFLEDGFGDISEISESVINSAVLLARVQYYKDCYFAIPFGYGRYLLKKNSYQRNYGLRVALNAIFMSIETNGELDPTRVRSVDSRTVSANTLYTRRQSTRKANFETFGIDIQSDLLKAVTGYPIDDNLWGPILTGGDSLFINLSVDLKDLGNKLKQIERCHRKNDYKDRFAWIDNVHVVLDLDVIKDLQNHLLEKLKNKDASSIKLAPPELIDWDEVDFFNFNIGPKVDHQDLILDDYLDTLESGGKLIDITIKQLRAVHKVEAYDSNRDIISRWSVYNCLDAEFELSGNTYLLNGGDFYEVANNYRLEIDTYVQSMEESDKDLPESVGDMHEGPYNELAANSAPNYLLLDKRTVIISTNTSPIEICDVLTDDNHFIHVKRKLRSSSLSHLFSQGYVSSDLLLMSQEYREKVLLEIQAAERDRASQENDPGFIGRFSTINLSGISPDDFEVVYAVIAKWDGKDLVESLPFFSKVNLRRFVEDLRRIGFNVSYKRVQIV